MAEPQIKKQALLIGINNYQHLTKLKYARQDAEAVAKSLKKNYCFSDDEIILLTDNEQGLLLPSTKEVVISHLNDLINQKPDFDLFIFGFWGHGLFCNSKRYLCLQTVMEKDVAEQGLSFDELQELFINIQSKNTCMILDCCQTTEGRGDSGSLTSIDKANLENAVLDIVSKKNKIHPNVSSNVAILNSCSEGQKAYEWDERRHGIFTAHLLEAMNNQYDSVSSVVSYLGNKVKNTALKMGRAQTPFFIIKGDGDIKLPVNAKNVFISYRHVNENLVTPVLNELDNQGISYFIDRKGILFSSPHYRILAEAIDACKLLLLFWTKEVHDNPTEIEREVSTALNNQKNVLPYRIGNFEIPHDSLYFLLNNLNHYEVSEQTEETINKLVNEVKKILRIPPPPPPPPTSSNSLKIIIGIILLFLLIISMIGFPAFFLKTSGAGSVPGEQKVLTVNGIEYSFRWCPPGKFTMGAPQTEEGLENELYGYETQHNVTLTEGFWIMETEVTVGMFEAFIKETGYNPEGNPPIDFSDSQHKNTNIISWRNPGFEQRDNNPVTCVSWEDANAFCKWLSDKTGKKIQLPTEAYWEYACRAGCLTPYADYIKEDETDKSREPETGNDLDKSGWYLSNSGNKTHPVKTKFHNQWNIYDMHGNVSEWCSDWMERYEAKSATDPLGPPDGSQHVFRGGSWNDSDKHCRSSFRNSAKSNYRSNNLGFRCCISLK